MLGIGTALSTAQVLELEELILCLDMAPILDQVNKALAACSYRFPELMSINILAYWYFQETEAKVTIHANINFVENRCKHINEG